MSDISKWERACNWILQDITTRRLTDGDRIPTEPDIQRASGVGRHSVRRALAVLASKGLVRVEQGRGTFVKAQPEIVYRIGRRTRFRENIIPEALTPGSDAVANEILAANATVAAALELEVGTPVHSVLRRGLADGRPISLARSFHPVDRFPDLGERRSQNESVTEIYRSHGIFSYNRRRTVLYARLPEKWEARLLEQHVEQPVVVMCKVDETADGTPIGWGESIWAAGRVRFELDGSD